MKRITPVLCTLVFVGSVWAQESEETTVTSTTTTVSSGANLLDDAWYTTDATPVAAGSTEFRLSFQWMSSSGFASNRGDSDDDLILTPSLYWGATDNLELSLGVPLWLGDGGDAGAVDDGNWDTYVGFLWQFAEDAWGQYDMGLAGTARIPTGQDSDKVDGELRLVMTHEYDNGVRSHFNIYGGSVNGTNLETFTFTDATGEVDDKRDFQYGAVIGMDGPLCGDGAVRWVFDYLHRSSMYEGQNNWNMGEIGWEWQMSDNTKLGWSFQASLDHSNDAPEFGSTITYAKALTY